MPHPRALEFLAAKIDGVTLANNHVLDYGPEALLDCLTLLDRAAFKRTGAGATLEETCRPAVFNFPQGPVAVVALTDNEPEWEATGRHPGMNYVAYNGRGLVEPYRSSMRQVLSLARRQGSLVVVSAHVGPNWGTPSRAMQALARDLIDLGADLYWGHSNHTPQGIQLYRGRPILDSTGDFVDDYFVDDYMVDMKARNDLSFLFVLDIEASRISRMRLHPASRTSASG